jgi:YD repeat-containing protein
MDQIPHARLLPVAQATPARHPGPAPEFLREHLPGNAATKDEHNAGEARAIRNARPSPQRPPWWNGQERFDKNPQRIWKQRCGHTGSRYFAAQNQVWRFCYTLFSTQLHGNVAIAGGGSTIVNAALAAPGTVSGRITQSDGVTGIPGAAVAVNGSGGASASATTDSTGAYSVSSIAPGTYGVEASAQGFAPQIQGGVVVAEGSVATVNLSLADRTPGTVRYVYDELGRLVSVVDTAGETARYSYDAVGNVTSITRQGSSSLAVLEFSPNQGPVATVVTITGTGFSTVPAENAVQFGGTAAVVTSATATSIVTAVPAGAATGPIGVTVASVSAASGSNFEVTADSGAPTITSFTPSIGVIGTQVTVTGTNFASSPASNVVAFNIARGGLNSATATQLVTPVPQAGTSGHIRVTTAFGSAISAADFYVPPAPYLPTDVDLTARVALGEAKPVSNTTTTKLQLLIFDAQAGQRVSLEFTNVTDGTRPFSWRKPDGSFLIAWQSGGTFVDAMTMPITGTYTVALLPGSLGNRTLKVHDASDFTGTIALAAPPVPVSIDTPGQNGRLTFTGVAGQQVSAVLSNVTVPTSDVSILNPDGTTLGSSVVVSGSDGFLDARILPVNGTYTLLFSPRQEYTGSATITLHEPTDAMGAIAADGNPVPVSTSIPGQNARRTFTAAAGDRVILKITGSTYAAGFTCGAAVSILDPAGSTLRSNGCVTQNETYVDTVAAPVAGTYTVFVNPSSSRTGGLTLTLYSVAADLTGTITPEVAITDTLSVGQSARYTFSGTAGARVSLDVPAGSISCAVLAILKADATVLASRFVCPTGFLEPAVLPSTETYTVLIDPDGLKTGTFTVVLYTVATDLSGTITPDAPLNVSIGDPGQNAAYTFTGASGQRVSLQIYDGIIPCVAVTIKNPNNTNLGATLGCPNGFIDTRTLGTSGTFSVVVDPSASGQGSLTLKLNNVPPDDSESTTIGGTGATVNTDTPGQNALVTFTASAGQVVTVTGSVSTMGCTTYKLLRPDASQQASTLSCGAGFTFANQTLATAGTYTITVDPSSTNIGHVTITVVQP